MSLLPVHRSALGALLLCLFSTLAAAEGDCPEIPHLKNPRLQQAVSRLQNMILFNDPQLEQEARRAQMSPRMRRLVRAQMARMAEGSAAVQLANDTAAMPRRNLTTADGPGNPIPPADQIPQQNPQQPPVPPNDRIPQANQQQRVPPMPWMMCPRVCAFAVAFAAVFACASAQAWACAEVNNACGFARVCSFGSGFSCAANAAMSFGMGCAGG